MEDPTPFELEQWMKEARRMITCTGCYGSGEDRWNQGRACTTCRGTGRSEAEPHTIRLVEYINKLRNRLGES